MSYQEDYMEFIKVTEKEILTMHELSQLWESPIVDSIEFFGYSHHKPDHYLYYVKATNNSERIIYVKVLEEK